MREQKHDPISRRTGKDVSCAKVCDVRPYGKKWGFRMRVPHTMKELIKYASHELGMLEAKCIILSEEGCVVTDVDTIVNRQRLYLTELILCNNIMINRPQI